MPLDPQAALAIKLAGDLPANLPPAPADAAVIRRF